MYLICKTNEIFSLFRNNLNHNQLDRIKTEWGTKFRVQTASSRIKGTYVALSLLNIIVQRINFIKTEIVIKNGINTYSLINEVIYEMDIAQNCYENLLFR